MIFPSRVIGSAIQKSQAVAEERKSSRRANWPYDVATKPITDACYQLFTERMNYNSLELDVCAVDGELHTGIELLKETLDLKWIGLFKSCLLPGDGHPHAPDRFRGTPFEGIALEPLGVVIGAREPPPPDSNGRPAVDQTPIIQLSSCSFKICKSCRSWLKKRINAPAEKCIPPPRSVANLGRLRKPLKEFADASILELMAVNPYRAVVSYPHPFFPVFHPSRCPFDSPLPSIHFLLRTTRSHLSFCIALFVYLCIFHLFKVSVAEMSAVDEKLPSIGDRAFRPRQLRIRGNFIGWVQDTAAIHRTLPVPISDLAASIRIVFTGASGKPTAQQLEKPFQIRIQKVRAMLNAMYKRSKHFAEMFPLNEENFMFYPKADDPSLVPQVIYDGIIENTEPKRDKHAGYAATLTNVVRDNAIGLANALKEKASWGTSELIIDHKQSNMDEQPDECGDAWDDLNDDEPILQTSGVMDLTGDTSSNNLVAQIERSFGVPSIIEQPKQSAFKPVVHPVTHIHGAIFIFVLFFRF